MVPGRSEMVPGRSEMVPGQSEMVPGQSEMVPGQSGMDPGQSGMVPGQSGMVQNVLVCWDGCWINFELVSDGSGTVPDRSQAGTPYGATPRRHLAPR